jgi:glyoxylase-like metal-dependent hydrolase (beta-lactamase superfamily II)
LEQLAPDVFRIALKPRAGLNAYLLGRVLVDAGTERSATRLLRALEGRDVAAHAITHAHADHAGGSRRVAEALGLPIWAGQADVPFLRAGEVPPGARLVRLLLGSFPPVEPARGLHEGDEIGHGFVALDVPGHTPGHVAFWREADRTLAVGDIIFNMHPATTRVGLHEPPHAMSADPAGNRGAVRRLAALEPALVLFGHGPPLADPDRLRAFAARLSG